MAKSTTARPLPLSWICAASAAGFMAMASAAFGQAIEQKAIEIAAVRDPQLGAQVAIADFYGYFKDEGLDVTVRWLQSAADTLTVMAGGDQNIGTGGTFTQIVFGGQKLPIKTIAPLADIAETQGFALSPNVKITEPKQLEGLKLAYTQGNSQILILAKLAKTYGFDMSKVQLINMNPSEGIVAASKGEVAGMLGWQPNLYRVTTLGGSMYATGVSMQKGGVMTELPFADRLQYNHSTLLASQKWIDEKPGTLKAVVKALLKATDLLAKDRPAALTALEKQLRIDPEPLKVMASANKYGLTMDDSFATSIAFQSDWALSIKRVPAPVTPEAVFEPKILRSIDPALVTWKPKS